MCGTMQPCRMFRLPTKNNIACIEMLPFHISSTHSKSKPDFVPTEDPIRNYATWQNAARRHMNWNQATESHKHIYTWQLLEWRIVYQILFHVRLRHCASIRSDSSTFQQLPPTSAVHICWNIHCGNDYAERKKARHVGVWRKATLSTLSLLAKGEYVLHSVKLQN